MPHLLLGIEFCCALNRPITNPMAFGPVVVEKRAPEINT
jgi:hypothetical protein